MFATICLLSSSAVHSICGTGSRARPTGRVQSFWFTTFGLGAIFLTATGLEWHHLIYDVGLTISTNLFGTTYYSLVGLHAFHLLAGLIGLAIVMAFAVAAKVRQEHAERIRVFGLYWHFVDAIWVVVFTVVYIIGR